MITISKAPSFRICNVCPQEENVYEVEFRYEGTNTGTRIALCENCRNKLKSLLEVEDENKKA